MIFTATNINLDSFISDYENRNFTVNHSYQRKFVWRNRNTSQELIYSIFMERPIGTIILWRKEDDHKEVIDGQQRLEIIIKFLSDTLTIDATKFVKIIEKKMIAIKNWLDEQNSDVSLNNNINSYIKNDVKKLQKIMNNYANNEVKSTKFSSLPNKFFKDAFNSYKLGLIIIIQSNYTEITEYFAAVQNQEKLRAGELIHSLPENYVSSKFPQIEREKLAEILHFNDLREDILKQINLICGVELGKLSFGVADNQILKFANNFVELPQGNKTIDLFLCKFKEDIDNFSIVKKCDMDMKEIMNKTFSKLSLKLLLASYLYIDVEYIDKIPFFKRIIYFKRIAKYIGIHNSINVDTKRYDINSDIQDSIYDLWKISKSSHNKDVFKRAMKNVEKIFDFFEEQKK